MIQHAIPRSFFGFYAADYELSFHREVQDFHVLGGVEPFRIHTGPTRTELRVSIIGSDTRAMYSLGQKLMYGDNFITLGKGRACPYCGRYLPTHVMSCPSCGGLTELFDGIKPRLFPFQAVHFDVSCVRDVARCDILMGGTGIVDVDDIFGGDTLYSLPHRWHFPSGYYLCQYCGMAVPEGKECPGCGGKQMPLTEIVKMDHTCIYCGTKITGGIVCRGCGARLQGLTISNLKEELQ